MVTCREAEDFFLDYFEGALPARSRRVFELHLRLCRDCRDYLAAYKLSVELGKAVFDDPAASAAEAVPEDLVKAILAARDREPN